MAWLFVRLKLRLIAGGLTGPGGGGRLTGLILAIVFGCVAMLFGFSGLASTQGTAYAGPAAVSAFTVLFLGWLVLPVLVAGSDETIDPARLALLPLTKRSLMTGLFAAALVGVAPVVTVVIAFGAVTATATGPVSVAVGLAAVVLELALCVTGSRAMVTLLSGVMRSRRGRDLGVLIGVLLGLSFAAMNLAMQGLAVNGGRGLREGATLVGGPARWTPPGMLAHSITAAARGDYPQALAGLAVGVLTVLLLSWAWAAALNRTQYRPDASSQGAARRARRAAATASRRAGDRPARRSLVIAGREFRYLRRDPRRRATLVSQTIIPFIGVPVMVSAMGSHGMVQAIGRPGVLVYGTVVGILLGSQSANQFGFDGAAFWMEVAVTSRAKDLRASMTGRNLVQAGAAATLIGLVTLVAGVLSGTGRYPAAAFGLAMAALGAAAGLGNIASVIAPVKLPERANPFGGGAAGSGCLAGLTLLGVLIGSLLLLTPLFALIATIHSGWWLLAAGPCYGAAIAWAGRLAASGIGFRRMPEILAVLTRPV